MIFVTVGTHEQQFNRLVEQMDKLVQNGIISEEVFIQTGYSTFQPKYCRWQQWLSYQDMLAYVNKARIVITHGGPSSFIMPLQIGKTPIVVPRHAKYNEHINDHQVKFCTAVAEQYKSIVLVENIEKLGDVIASYNEIILNMSEGQASNNAHFNEKLDCLVNELFV